MRGYDVSDGTGHLIQRLIAVGRPDLAERLKHLPGKHNQQRHGWRFARGGDDAARLGAARRSMRGRDAGERAEYRKRAGMPEARRLERKPSAPTRPKTGKDAARRVKQMADQYDSRIASLKAEYKQVTAAAGAITDSRRQELADRGIFPWKDEIQSHGGVESVMNDEFFRLMKSRSPEHESLLKRSTEIERERQKVMRERDRKLREQLYVDDPANFDVRIRLSKDDTRFLSVEAGVSETSKMVSASVFNDVRLEFRDTLSSRSFAGEVDNLAGPISLSKTAGARTVVHEIGHILEASSPTVHRKSVDFLLSRAGDKPTESLNKIQDSAKYREDEVVWQDKFVDPYMGKRYYDQNTGGHYATEILSMGLQMFYDDPSTLARKDPEYFAFIFDLVRGN